MRHLKYYFYSILKVLGLAFLLVVSSRFSHAIPRPPPLTNGMTYNEVIKLWGSPVERTERETKREDTWLYKLGKVEFRDGSVYSWGYSDGLEIENKTHESDDANSKVALGGPEGKDSLQVEELLTEIMKSGSPDDAPGSQGAVGNSMNPPPVNMPGVAVPPPATME